MVMDDFWIRKDNKFYDPLKGCFVKAVRQYEFDFPSFICNILQILELTNMELVGLCQNT